MMHDAIIFGQCGKGKSRPVKPIPQSIAFDTGDSIIVIGISTLEREEGIHDWYKQFIDIFGEDRVLGIDGQGSRDRGVFG